MKQRVAVVLLALVGAMLPLGASFASGSSTPALVVDDDGKATAKNCNSSTATLYTTIQAAVDAAAVNGRIVVCPGNYAENVVVDKAGLKVEGPSAGKSHAKRVGGLFECGGTTNEAVVTGDVDDGVASVQLVANKVTWTGFVVSGNGDGPGLYTSPSASGYQISRNTFENNVFGVYLHSRGSFLTKFEDNCVSDNNIGLGVLPAAGNGIYSDQGAQSIQIIGNKVRDHGNGGILFANVPAPQLRLTISKNQSIDDFVFLRLWSTENATVEYNTVTNVVPNSGSAIRIGSDNNVILIRKNEIKSAGFSGIAVRDQGIDPPNDGFGTNPPRNIKIIDNNIRNAVGSGIDVTADGKSTTVSGNTIKASGENGIFFDASTAGNLIEKNTALDNNQSGGAFFDCNDDSVGTGTLGTANTWKKNIGKTSDPVGLCKKRW